MKSEKILDIIGQVDEKFILEAAPGKVRKRKYTRWISWGAMAACACLIVYVGARTMFFEGTDTCSDTAGNTSNMGIIHPAESASQEYAMGSADGFLMEGSPAESAPAQETEKKEQTAGSAVQSGGVQESVTEESAPMNWGVTLTAKKVGPTGLTLVCTQSGGKITGELQTGSEYKIQVWDGNTWAEVATQIDEYAWTMLAYQIPKEDSVQWKIDWEWLYGELPEGKYRLIKSITDFRVAGDYDTETFYVEFEVK